jgi:predicted nucleic acid-binding protein
LFDDIAIPLAVRDEILALGPGQPDAAAVTAAPWIQPRAVTDQSMVRTLLTRLGQGEAEALALAVEMGGDIPVLLDDRAARRMAAEHGLRIFGSAGVLVLAKERALVPHVRPLLDALRQAGLFLGDAVYERLLAMAGE